MNCCHYCRSHSLMEARHSHNVGVGMSVGLHVRSFSIFSILLKLPYFTLQIQKKTSCQCSLREIELGYRVKKSIYGSTCRSRPIDLFYISGTDWRVGHLNIPAGQRQPQRCFISTAKTLDQFYKKDLICLTVVEHEFDASGNQRPLRHISIQISLKNNRT